jgi:predicted Zn-dependent protease
LPEVQSRLAALRLDLLDDTQGALELLEPLLAKHPEDDESRQRYRGVAVEQGRHADAEKLLKRAARQLKDDAARVRVSVDLAQLLLHAGKKDKAESELTSALKRDVDSPAMLRAAELLQASFGEPDQEQRALVLAALARSSEDESVREQAADDLLALAATLPEPSQAAHKKTALVAFLQTARAAELLDEAEHLCEKEGDRVGLAQVFSKRASLASDP